MPLSGRKDVLFAIRCHMEVQQPTHLHETLIPLKEFSSCEKLSVLHVTNKTAALTFASRPEKNEFEPIWPDQDDPMETCFMIVIFTMKLPIFGKPEVVLLANTDVLLHGKYLQNNDLPMLTLVGKLTR